MESKYQKSAKKARRQRRKVASLLLALLASMSGNALSGMPVTNFSIPGDTDFPYVLGSEESTTQGYLEVTDTTTLTVTGTSTFDVLYGSYATLGDVELNYDTGTDNSLVFTVNGNGTFDVTTLDENGTEVTTPQTFNSTLAIRSLTPNKAGALTFNVQDGAYADFGSFSGAQEAGSSLDITVTGKSYFRAPLDTSGATEEWTGVMTLGAPNGGDVNISVQEGSMIYAGTSLEMTLQDGNSVEITGAGSQIRSDGSLDMNLLGGNTLQLDDESQIHAASTLSMNIQNGSNITLDKGSFIGSDDSVTMNFQGGNTFTLDNKSSIYAKDSIDITLQDQDEFNVLGGSSFLQATEGSPIDVSIFSNAGTANLNIVGASSQIMPSGALNVGAEEDSILEIYMHGATVTEGVDHRASENLAFLSSTGDFILGGAGTTTVNAEECSILGSTANMIIGDTDGGTVNLNLSGAGTYLCVRDMYETGADNIGKITIAQNGTANINLKDSTFILAEKNLVVAQDADAVAHITLENDALLESYGNITLGQGGVANLSLKGASQIRAKKGLVLAENDGANTNIELQDTTALVTEGSMIVGQAGLATVEGTGNLVAGKELIVGQKANDATSSVNLRNSYVEVAGLAVGAEEGANGSFTLKGNESFIKILENTDAELASLGNGTIEFTNVSNTDYSSLILMEKGAQLHANDGITFDNSYLYINGPDTIMSAKRGGVHFTNNAILDGTFADTNITGDVEFDGATYKIGMTTDGQSNQINVTDGKLTIGENSKLEINFINNGNITADEWTVAEILSENGNDQITGEWDIVSPLEIYTFDQSILDGGKKQILSMTLREEYFNGRANTMQLARQSLWNAVDDRVSWNADGVAYCGNKSPIYNYNERSSFWAKSGYRGMDVKGANGYNIDAFNLTIGADCAFEEYFAAGAFINFSNPELQEDHEYSEANNYSFGLYGGYKTWGGFELKGMAAYTLSDYELHRNMGTAGSASAEFRGSTLTASVEMARPFTFGNLILRPLFAIDTECVWQGGAIERGAYALNYDKADDSWTYARAGAKFDFAPAQRFVLSGKAFYAHQLDDDGATVTSARFFNSNETMEHAGAYVGNDYINLGLSATFMFSERVSAFADYDGYFADEAESHLVQGGFQVNF